MRDVLCKRSHVVRQQTATVLSLHNIVVRKTGVRHSAKRMHALTLEELQRLLPELDHILAVTGSLAVLQEAVAEQIATRNAPTPAGARALTRRTPLHPVTTCWHFQGWAGAAVVRSIRRPLEHPAHTL